MKELEIYGVENSQPLQTRKDVKMKNWLLGKDQVQGTARNSSSKASGGYGHNILC